LLGRIGPEQYAEVLDLHRAILGQALADFGGREVDSRGEELFAVFARAQDAVAAAVAVERAHRKELWPPEAEIKVRIGIHTGEPAVRDGSYLGLDVHRAARICTAGHGGQVLLSQTSHALAVDTWQGELRAKDLGEHMLKGARPTGTDLSAARRRTE
jgi:class 3 adenylate cyclase